MLKSTLVFAIAAVIAPIVHAQQAPIPVRQLGAITASGSDTLGALVIVRALSDGSVIVNDAGRKRLLRYDAKLEHSTVIMDSSSAGTIAGFGAFAASALIRHMGDSTLYPDVTSQSLLVLDAMGKVARVMALPHPQDAFLLATGSVMGMPGVDPKGRLVYRGMIRVLPKPSTDPTNRMGFDLPQQPDSAPIVRTDFDTRAVDTVATMKILQPGSMKMKPDAQGNIMLSMTINPMDMADEWAMLSDGSIAIVRAHDYHVDWIEMDGTHRSTPKMQFDWKRLTDEQKQFKIDSLRPEVEKGLAQLPVQTIPTPDGPRKLQIQIDFPPITKLSDYDSPVSPGSVKPDLNGNLWIVPHTSAVATGGGLLYDVVNKQGEISMRVQFPKGYALAGFGEKGAIYVTRTDGKTSFLERASLAK